MNYGVKNRIGAWAMGMAVVGFLVPAARAEPAVPAPVAAVAQSLPVPPPDALLMMIRANVLAVGQANLTRNYDVLRGLGSNSFRERNSSEALVKTFAPVADLGLDFSPVVVTTPVLTEPPSIADGKLLRVNGAFPTAPMEVPFGILFEVEGGAWKLNAISVGVRPAAKVAELTMPMSSPTQAAGVANDNKKAVVAKKK